MEQATRCWGATLSLIPPSSDSFILTPSGTVSIILGPSHIVCSSRDRCRYITRRIEGYLSKAAVESGLRTRSYHLAVRRPVDSIYLICVLALALYW